MSENQALESLSLFYPNMRVERFSLKAGEIVPLHIHPGQYGFLYLLRGQCLVKTYEINDHKADVFTLSHIADHQLADNSHCELTPTVNAHLIKVIKDSMFLDVFAPGVELGGLSIFLEPLNESNMNSSFKAKRIPRGTVKLPGTLSLNSADQVKRIL